MAGMKFEYDENGAKFVYFLISFYAMIIIPCTYYLWPRKEKKSKFIRFLFSNYFSLNYFLKGEQHPEDLSCFEPCLIKNQLLNQNIPKKRLNEKIM
jgi:preprotein translocase subunit Sec63